MCCFFMLGQAVAWWCHGEAPAPGQPWGFMTYRCCTLVIASCSRTKRRRRCPVAAAVVHRSLPPSSDLDSLGNGLTLTWPGGRWLLMKDTALVYSATKSPLSSATCSRSPSLSLRTRISRRHHESVLCPRLVALRCRIDPTARTPGQPATSSHVATHSPPAPPPPPGRVREAACCLMRVIHEQIR
jgi:hypothetical protein